MIIIFSRSKALVLPQEQIPIIRRSDMPDFSSTRPETDVLNRIAADYESHRDQSLYNRYLHQLTTAYSVSRKGERSMVCEGLLNLFGTSSEEIIEKTQRADADYYQPQIDSLASQNQYLMDLLKKNNIPFESASAPKG